MRKTSAIAAALGGKDQMGTGRAPGPMGHAAPPAAKGARAVPMHPAQRIDGDFPAGVYDQSMTQVAPFLGGHQLPTGQTINVSMNAANPHLSFKEWMGRGIVAGIGHAAAWPFRLCAGIVEDIARSIVALLGKLVLFVLLPTALIMGYKLAMSMKEVGSVEDGAAQIVHHGRHAANGVAKGLTDDLPPEKKAAKEDVGKDARR